VTTGPTGGRNTGTPPSTTGKGTSTTNPEPGKDPDATPGPTSKPEDPPQPNPNPVDRQPTETPRDLPPKPTEGPEPTVREVPTSPNPVAVARSEIQQWLAEYTAAYQALDGRRVREMNRRGSVPALLSAVTVRFSIARIDVQPDGQRAALVGKVRYEYKWHRAGPPVSETEINWPMTKVGSAWVAY
jgi:hypothetical protein